MITDTKSQKPPMRSSDEANQEQLALARAQGEAMQKALEHMTKKEAHGAEKPAGDYLVGYAVEEAEGMYHFRDGQLQWHDPRKTRTFTLSLISPCTPLCGTAQAAKSALISSHSFGILGYTTMVATGVS